MRERANGSNSITSGTAEEDAPPPPKRTRTAAAQPARARDASPPAMSGRRDTRASGAMVLEPFALSDQRAVPQEDSPPSPKRTRTSAAAARGSGIGAIPPLSAANGSKAPVVEEEEEEEEEEPSGRRTRAAVVTAAAVGEEEAAAAVVEEEEEEAEPRGRRVTQPPQAFKPSPFTAPPSAPSALAAREKGSNAAAPRVLPVVKKEGGGVTRRALAVNDEVDAVWPEKADDGKLYYYQARVTQV
ncbi:hypothetical protein T484DRAFT_1951002, partial [Baffinella frigidus]